MSSVKTPLCIVSVKFPLWFHNLKHDTRVSEEEAAGVLCEQIFTLLVLLRP